MSHKIIPASSDTECCCCGTSNIELNVFMGGIPEREHGHCEICYGTFAGNACVYPQNYSDNADVMKTMAQIGNIILRKLRS